MAGRCRAEAMRRLIGFARGVSPSTQRGLDALWPDLGAAVAFARLYAQGSGIRDQGSEDALHPIPDPCHPTSESAPE
jgi:hypothetical protein